jgi:hypothetical protein
MGNGMHGSDQLNVFAMLIGASLLSLIIYKSPAPCLSLADVFCDMVQVQKPQTLHPSLRSPSTTSTTLEQRRRQLHSSRRDGNGRAIFFRLLS